MNLLVLLKILRSRGCVAYFFENFNLLKKSLLIKHTKCINITFDCLFDLKPSIENNLLSLE